MPEPKRESAAGLPPKEKPEAEAGIEISSWLVAAPALIYATGFIVVFTAEDRLGLTSLTGDFFKIKYLHVGVLCAAFVGLFAGPGYALRALGTQTLGVLRPALFLVVMPVVAGIYVQLSFAPPGSFSGAMSAMLLAYSVCALAGGYVLGRIKDEGRKQRFRRPWLILLGSLGAAFLILEIVSIPWASWPSPGRFLMSILLLALFSALIGRTLHKVFAETSSEADRARRHSWWLLGGSLCAFLYYIVAYGFALSIYPHIPVRKGGGDYADAPMAVIHFAADAIESIPAELRGAGKQSQPVVILVETAEAIYAAKDNSNSRALWGKTVQNRPERIYQLARPSVIAVEFMAAGAIGKSNLPQPPKRN